MNLNQGMLEQIVYTIKCVQVECALLCTRSGVGLCGSVGCMVALLCVMLVVVGIMTRCAIQVVSCIHGHLDMLMGSPWCHGRCGRLVLVLMHGVSHAPRCRQDTHIMVALPWSSCIEVMGGAVGL